MKFQDVEDPPKPKLLKESMNQNWNFQGVGGFKSKSPLLEDPLFVVNKMNKKVSLQT